MPREECGIGHAKALCGDGLVAGDELDDFFDLDLVGRELEAAQERAEGDGHGGHCFEIFDARAKRSFERGIHRVSPSEAHTRAAED